MGAVNSSLVIHSPSFITQPGRWHTGSNFLCKRRWVYFARIRWSHWISEIGRHASETSFPSQQQQQCRLGKLKWMWINTAYRGWARRLMVRRLRANTSSFDDVNSKFMSAALMCFGLTIYHLKRTCHHEYFCLHALIFNAQLSYKHFCSTKVKLKINHTSYVYFNSFFVQ